ncbi:aspartate kinase [Adhaeribacter sp. BT258]|uniref:Aspartokinase n=1 Tax=Adhaeribacter terrigena TaxID=2793070 RepID=A0ABS1C3K6_9BACT|nr:aspartate kinase [Adhaeribacter terrigena]MBK0403898.1 aspartate kinase [Adhaeribacter terrigena]
MKVLKFGGTSVGSAARIKNVAQLVQRENRPVLVVLSAMSGTTNRLVDITGLLKHKRTDEAKKQIQELHRQYQLVAEELFETENWKQQALQLLEEHFQYLQAFTQDLFTVNEERAILAQGELLSTALFHFHLLETMVPGTLLPALNFMRLDQDQEPDMTYIRENLQREISQHDQNQIFVTQGYICRNTFGEIDNLKRGGSDYSASLIGAALKAEEIQIWTDIDGMHNNDPRIVKNTYPIAELSFDEAAELAYFGAKILHPSSVWPAKQENIPVRLLNTMQPEARGTLISGKTTGQNIKAVAAKDCITAIKIQSSRMLLAYGFLRSVFEVFEVYKTPIDMITTSEVAVSITIDDTKHLGAIVEDLKLYGNVEVEQDQTIICIVGDFLAESTGYALEVVTALQHIPLRMISYGGSKNNISFLIKTEHKVEALTALNDNVFGKSKN